MSIFSHQIATFLFKRLSLNMIWKEKWRCIPKTKQNMDQTVRDRGKDQIFQSTWQISTNVHNVPKRWFLKANWRHTCSSTVEKRPTLAQNVRSHLVKQEHWGSTWSSTRGRKNTNVRSVERHLVKLYIWNSTCSPTVGRSHTNVHNAIMHLQEQTVLEITPEHIP